MIQSYGLPRFFRFLCLTFFSYYTFFIDLYTSKVEGNSENFRGGVVRWHVEGRGLSYPLIEKANETLNESIKEGIYRYPEDIFQEFMGTPHGDENGLGFSRRFIEVEK